MNSYSFKAFPIRPKAILDVGGSSLMCSRVQDKRFFHATQPFSLQHTITNTLFPNVQQEYDMYRIDLKFKAKGF